MLATDGPARGAEVTTLAGRPGPVTALAVTGTAPTRVVAGGADGAVRVWDVTSGAAVSVARGHAGPVTALTATGQGTVVSGGVDGTLRSWDPATGAPLGLLEGGPAVVAVVVPTAGQLLAATADGALHVFALVDGVPQDAVRLDVPGDGVAATAAACAGEGRVVVGRVDGTVQLVPTSGPGPVAELAGHGAAVRAVTADAAGTVVATGDDHGRVLVWDSARARPGAGGHAGVSPRSVRSPRARAWSSRPVAAPTGCSRTTRPPARAAGAPRPVRARCGSTRPARGCSPSPGPRPSRSATRRPGCGPVRCRCPAVCWPGGARWS
ncbi:hypothetical protein [Pseudonocardia alni]|uniref:WD40 repeat domain-containing protein n=1 Tax=Pseudonocardia alni TaxID=33907 RepID=UPI0027A3C333|nr:hypothetical protein PaSha_19060 [Pseudonocardia alni]